MFVAADALSRFFFADEALAAQGSAFVRLLAPGLPFLGITAAAEHSYSGAGRTLPPMLLELAAAWLLTIPAMAWLGLGTGWGAHGAMAGIALGQALTAGIGFVMLRRGSWLTHEV